MLFSERKGLKPVRSAIQTDSVDEPLRNRLWNATFTHYWEILHPSIGYGQRGGLFASQNAVFQRNMQLVECLVHDLWNAYFKQPLDTINTARYGDGSRSVGAYNYMKDYFFSCSWYEVYDFIEFIARNSRDRSATEEFVLTCNHVLESECSAYRFVNGVITELTSPQEIDAIEKALALPSPLAVVSNHLQRALKLCSNRTAPDHRNSIKESILAVEAACQLIAGEKKATLGRALRRIGKQCRITLHPAMTNAFNSLYGYTSDADGIRHALLEETHLDFDDAKFMLVSCSAFTNYLVSKATQAGITLASP